MRNRFGSLALMLVLFIQVAFAKSNSIAAPDRMLPAENIISNITEAKSAVKDRSELPVLWPTMVPVQKRYDRLYAHYSSYGVDPDYSKYWSISANVTFDCHGAHVCMEGSMSAEKPGNIDEYYETLPDNKRYKKQQVKLENKYTGYYTPFHIGAGGIEPTIEWQIKEVVYTLRWKDASREVLIEMANSAIREPFSRKP